MATSSYNETQCRKVDAIDRNNEEQDARWEEVKEDDNKIIGQQNDCDGVACSSNLSCRVNYLCIVTVALDWLMH